jgi:hypothetical protein
MVNYGNGKIYLIEPSIEKLDDRDIYVGSTTKEFLSQRMDTHRNGYRRWKRGMPVSRVTSYEIFDKYGIENCKITLLEAYPCNSRDELTSREAHFIRTMQCVNKYIPQRTPKEYRADFKEKLSAYHSNYGRKNKEKIKLYGAIRFECECGSIFRQVEKSRHCKTIKHTDFLEEKKTSVIGH